MTALWEPLLLLVMLGVLMYVVLIPLMTGRPITRLSGIGRMHEPETTTPFHTVGYVVLGLVALGDAGQVYALLGDPLAAGALLGALVGLVGHRASRWVFVPLGVLAAVSSALTLLSGPPERTTLATAALLPLAIGIGSGVLAFGERDPINVLAKVCTAFVLTSFAVAPPWLGELGPDLAPWRVALTLAAAAAAGGLLAFRGPGMALLLGIGIGFLGIYYGIRTGTGPPVIFIGAFLLLWFLSGRLRDRLGQRRVRGA